MKIYRDISGISNKRLVIITQKITFGLFCIGFSVGMTIVLAGMSAKNNDFEGALILVGIAIFLLSISIVLFVFVRSRLLLEIEERLNIK